VHYEPDVLGLGESRSCFDAECPWPPVAVVVFGSPSQVGDWLCPTVIRFCVVHEQDAWNLSHSWDSEVVEAYQVDAWDSDVREMLFPEGLDDAVTVTRRYG
jgi:hypothetical protein